MEKVIRMFSEELRDGSKHSAVYDRRDAGNDRWHSPLRWKREKKRHEEEKSTREEMQDLIAAPDCRA